VAEFQTTLLRLVDEPRSEKSSSLTGMVEAGRNAARAALIFLAGVAFALVKGKVAREGIEPQRHREANDSARRGSLWDWGAFSSEANLRLVYTRGPVGRICCA